MSSGLHLGVILATIYGLPQILEPLEVQDQQIIVELVTIAKHTTTQKPSNKDAKKERPPAPEIKQNTKNNIEPKQEKTPISAKKTAMLAPSAAPESSKAERAFKKMPKSKPADLAKQKLKTPKPPKEKPKPPKLATKSEPSKKFRNLPRPRNKPERKKLKFNAERIAALLDKDEEKKTKTRGKKIDWKKTIKDLSNELASSPERQRTVPMTMSEIDAIRYQIQRCWSIPAGARYAEKLIIRIKIYLNTDGSLSKAPEIVDTTAQRNNPFYITAAESARRAVLKCAPLKNLPIEKFARWREITLTFDPREMLGG